MQKGRFKKKQVLASPCYHIGWSLPVWFRRVLQRREPGVGVVVVVVVGSGWQEAITRGLEEEERERGDTLDLFVS